MKQQCGAAVKEVGRGKGAVSEYGFILVYDNGARLTAKSWTDMGKGR